MSEQHLPLRLHHLAQSDRTRVIAQRRRGLELLAGDHPVDQARNLGGRCKSAVSGLPCLDLLASGKAQTPDDSGLGRQPRDRHTQPLEVAVHRVVVVRDGELVLGAHPVLVRRARLEPLRDREGSRPDRVPVRLLRPHFAQRHPLTVTYTRTSVQVEPGRPAAWVYRIVKTPFFTVECAATHAYLLATGAEMA